MTVRWKFEDPVTAEVYIFPHNPQAMTSSRVRRAFSTGRGTYTATRGISQRQPSDWEFSGKLRTQAQYDAFVNWSQRQYPFRVVDHFGEVRIVIAVKFEPQDKRDFRNPWLHTYTFKCRIVPTDSIGSPDQGWL